MIRFHDSARFALALVFTLGFATFAPSVSAQVVTARTALDGQVSYGDRMARDLGLNAASVRNVRLSTGKIGDWIHGSGAEVRFTNAEGATVLTVEQVRFASAEEAQAFFEEVFRQAPRPGERSWSIELRGEWIVRAGGPALEDFDFLDRALRSAWRRGHRAARSGRREAHYVSLTQGQIFEDNLGLAIGELVDARLDDVKSRAASGDLGSVESLTEAGQYLIVAPKSHRLYEREGDSRRGWTAQPQAAQAFAAYAQKSFTQSGGATSALARLLGR
ncbi:MAG: hypothetical protein JKY65_21520 [Planctomycetes bacterium]|nr:hypothetical protein [Planctomycetota bacterium]